MNAWDSHDEAIRESVVKGKVDLVNASVNAAVADEMDVEEIIATMVRAMTEVGDAWISGEMFIPEVIASARAVHAGQDILRPLLKQERKDGFPPVIIGTVLGDLHDIGKNLVKLMLESGGFDVTDLGVNVPAERFVDALRNNESTILCMSALLTTTMPQMRVVVDSLGASGRRESTTVVVGGACVSAGFADEIGADGYGSNAAEGVLVCKEAARGAKERI
ncbi:MAG: cobalamin-dependent protein [Thermoleophilia bacterium]|nr:cobalamin-dependent protein [Thermoleophilia bacterium]